MFNEVQVLSYRINIRYWHGLPGILVGFGILGTFIGLTLGLFEFGSVSDMQQSIKILLSGMATAFVTSVWGMCLSLIFNGYEKRKFNNISLAIGKLNRQIDKLFALTTQEKISMEQQDQLEQQTLALKSFSTDLADRIKVAMDTIMASRLDSLQGVIENLYSSGATSSKLILNEIKETANNITNGLRESIGSIMVEKLSPSLESVANSINNLLPIVESLREEKQETSINAIKELVDEFRITLSGSTKSEMERLASLIDKAGESLLSFPSHLESMLVVLSEQSDQIKSLLTQSSSQAQEEMNRRLTETQQFFTEILNAVKTQSAEHQKAVNSVTEKMRGEFESSTLGFAEIIEDLQTKVKEILDKQESNTEIVNRLINSSTAILSEGSALAQNMDKTIKSVFDAINQMQNTTTSLTSTSTAFQNTAEQLKISTDMFLQKNQQSIEGYSNIIDKIAYSLEISKSSLTEYVNKFGVIETGLNSIFAKLQDGLDQYGKKVGNELNNSLAQFSTHLSEAVKQLSGSVEYLEDIVKDIIERVEKGDKKK